VEYFREMNCVSCGVNAHNKENIRQVNCLFPFFPFFQRASGMNGLICHGFGIVYKVLKHMEPSF